MPRRRIRGSLVAPATCVILASVSACRRVEGGPPDSADVEEHLDLAVGYIPEGCDPVALGGEVAGESSMPPSGAPKRGRFGLSPSTRSQMTRSFPGRRLRPIRVASSGGKGRSLM